MPRNNVYCDHCEKTIGSDKLAWFSDAKKDLDFCSKDCFLTWAEQTKVDLGFIDYLKKQSLDLQTIKDKLDELKEKYHQAQIWMDWNYLAKRRVETTKLDISNQNLKGELDLSEFIELEELNCSDNQLTNLNLSNCKKIKEIDCGYNKLINLDLTNLKKLTHLDIRNNNLLEKNLDYFKDLTDLQNLLIGNNDKEKIQTDIYNRFSGSLESLKNLRKLETLDISNTDINIGVEHLPNNLKKIYYSTEARSDSKLKEVTEDLKWWDEIGHDFIPEVKNKWKEKGFDYKETKELVSECKLEAKESDLAKYLQEKGVTPGWSTSLLDKLRVEFEKCQEEDKQKEDKKARKRNRDDSIVYDQADDVQTQDLQSDSKEEFFMDQGASSESIHKKRQEEKLEQIISSYFNNDKDFINYLKENKRLDPNKLLISNLIKLNREYHVSKVEKEIKGIIDANKRISDKELDQKLTTDDNQPWQSYLNGSKTPSELDNRKKAVLDAIKEVEIESLKSEIKELVESIRQQKKKIVEIFLQISPERELLKELINEYLEFNKFKNQEKESGSVDYNEKCDEYEMKYWKVKSELQRKLNKEEMNKVRYILTCCEKLVHWESDLKERASRLLLTGGENNPQITAFIDSIKSPLKIEYDTDNDAQKWVDERYPKEERSKEIKLDISKEKLKGELKLEGFTKLEELNCSHNQLTKLWISDCPQLKTLNCSFNKLEFLNLTNLGQLEKLACNDNHLMGLDFSSLNPEKLINLNISDNKFSEQKLSAFSRFVNLESLLVGSEDKEKINQGIYNRFYGSLEPLKDMKKLELLYISNTDIDEGLEYLSNSLEEIYCSNKENPESKVKVLAKELNNFLIDEDKESYNFQNWKNKQLEARVEVLDK